MEDHSISERQAKFVYYRIPRDDHGKIDSIVSKYRELRLTGLRLSPESFSSTLATEIAHPTEYWKTRLQYHEFETFVCAIPETRDSDIDVLGDEAQWVAQVTLRGPISAEDYELPGESGQARLSADAAVQEERWQIMRLYMLPAYRGQGIAKRLVLETLNYLQTARLRTNSDLRAIHVRAMIKPDNVASYQLFSKLGFLDSARCTLAEALKANGERIPEHADDKFHTRSGRVLIQVIEKQ